MKRGNEPRIRNHQTRQLYQASTCRMTKTRTYSQSFSHCNYPGNNKTKKACLYTSEGSTDRHDS